MTTPERSVEKTVKRYTKPQDIIDKNGNKIGESHWSPYCIQQLTKAIQAERQKQKKELREASARQIEWFREWARSQNNPTFTLEQIESYLDMQ